MGAEIVKALLDCLKLKPRYLLAICFVTGFLLYGRAQLLQQLGVAEFAQDYRPILGVALLGAGALLIATFVSEALAFIKRRWYRWRVNLRAKQRLQALTEDEKQILRYYVAKQTRTNVLRIQDGVVKGLVSAGVIYQATNRGTLLGGFAYNITEYAWKYLQKDETILIGETNIYRSDHWRDFLDE